MGAADTTDNGATVSDHLAHAAARFGDRPFLDLVPAVAARYETEPYTLTFADVRSAARDLAADYRTAGIEPGMRVGLALENRPEFLVHLYALNALGASVVPINIEMSAPEQAHLLGHSDLVAVVAVTRALDGLARVASELPRAIAVTGSDLSGLAAGVAGTPAAAPDEAALMYTSGTTGQPKGCILSNEYFEGLGRRYLDMGGLCALDEAGERLVTPLPLTHMNALACSMMAMLMSGGCLVQLDRFHPKSWWATVREARASIVHYLGVMPAMLLNLPPGDDDFSEQVKFGFGAGCDPRHQATFEARFGFPLIEAWAMTETGAGAWISADHEPRHVGRRCFGRAPDHLEYRLVDESGHDVPAGEPGELLVRRRGPDPRRCFFLGYYKDESATDEVWADGWFHTGDVVRVDDHGAFYFVDRRKNVIRRSGENIAAVEVEGCLFQHGGVANCAVTAVPDEIRGDEVLAMVVAAEGVVADAALAESIVTFALEQLVYFKAPAYVAFVDDLPKTASEKIQRGEVKKRAAARLAAGDVFDLRRLKKRPSA